MTTDMLHSAGEIEGVRVEAFAAGDVAEPRRASARLASAPPGRSAPIASRAAPPLDLRALVMRAVVPRLAENLRPKSSPCALATAPDLVAVRPHDGGRDGIIGDMVDALLRDDLAGLCRSIEAARAEGRPLDRVYLDLLAPAAAAIARLVDADGCSAAAGTLAFCNLQLALRRYAADFYEEGGAAPQGSHALLLPARATGGLSTFGLLLAADFLRRAGWEAWIEASFRSSSLEGTVGGRWFDLVEILADDDGLCGDELRQIADGVRAIRRDGANPDVVVVACGAAFVREPALVSQVGADHAGTDPLSALGYFSPCSRNRLDTQTRRRRHLS